MKPTAFAVLAGLCLTAVPAFAGSGELITLAQVELQIGPGGVRIHHDRDRYRDHDRDRYRDHHRDRYRDHDRDRYRDHDRDRY